MLGKGKGNNEKISSEDNGVGAPAVVKLPPVTVSAVERGSHEVREQPTLADTSEASGTSANVLEGDLTQLAEKLHQLETQQLRRFVEDLQTALREVALEPSDRPGTDVVTPPVISAPVSSPPDVTEHAAEYPAITETPPPTSVPNARRSSARRGSQWGKLLLTALREVALEPSDRPGTDVVTSPVIFAPVSSPPDVPEHAAEYPSMIETPPLTSMPNARRSSARRGSRWGKLLQTALREVALEPSDRLGTGDVTSPVISAPVSSPPDVTERASEYPTIIETPPPTSMPNARRGGSQRGKRAGLLLALSAVTASIPWELPVLYANLPQTTPIIEELVVRRDAPEPSQRGHAAQEIAPVEGTVASAAQAPSLPLEEATLEPSDRLGTEVVTSPVISAPASSPPDVTEHPAPVNDIEALIDRGDQLLRQGDIIAARAFYERAAASGSARAASGVARTFDPQFLSRLGVVGVRGDPERAATWYRTASQAAARQAGPHPMSDGGSN